MDPCPQYTATFEFPVGLKVAVAEEVATKEIAAVAATKELVENIIE